MSDFVLSVRNKIPDGAGGQDFGKNVGPASYLEIPAGAPAPKPQHSVGGVSAWMKAIVAESTSANGAAGKALDVVFFVHGYNTPAQESLTRQRWVQTNLRKRGFDCMVVGFDWPTAENAVLYPLDREKAQDAAKTLVRGGLIPFTKFILPDCPIRVHLMAHSMGGFVVREAFRDIDKKRDADLSNDWRIGQLVLFAADVSSECFELGHADMLPVFAHCGRLTNYFSGYDEALGVSNVKNVDVNSRVGRVGMPVDTPAHEKALDVDCGPRYKEVPNRTFNVINGMTSHSWYLEDDLWYDDLAYTLQGHIDRDSIPTRKRLGENDYVLQEPHQ